MSGPDETSASDSLEALRQQVAALTSRVYRLEGAVLRPEQFAQAAEVAAPAVLGPHKAPTSGDPVAMGGPVKAAPPPFVPVPVAPRVQVQRQQSLESRIGSFFLNRIGVIAVMIGMAWFLKLAFDRNWLGPPVLVSIGLVVAVGLVLWSERFRRRNFVVFSYSLKALGTGIAYLSLWAAYSVYGLISPGLAFAAMVVVTAANGMLAWMQDSELLALYALVGGLATPALLSTGQDHELFLLSYLMLLDVAAVSLCASRPWNRLILGSFAGTAVYFGLWWVSYYSVAAFGLTGVFLLLFFVLFTAAPLIALHVTGRRFRLGLEDAPAASRAVVVGGYDEAFRGFMVTGLPIAVHGVAFLGAMAWAGSLHLGWLRTWLALGLALASLGVDLLVRGLEGGVGSASLRQAGGPAASPVRPAADLLADVHFGLAILFVALAAWLEFHRHSLGFCGLIGCWLAEAVVLAAVITLVPPHHHRPATAADHVTLPRAYTTLMLAAASITLLLLEWFDPPGYFVRPVLNAHFGTYLAGLAVLAATAWLCRGWMAAQARYAAAAGGVEVGRGFSTGAVEPGSLLFLAGYAVIAFNLVALVAGTVQIHLYWVRDDLQQSALRLPLAGQHIVGFSYSAWFMAYGAVLMAVGFLRRSAFLRWQALVLLAFAIGKVFVVDSARLSQGYRVMSFLGLGALLLAISFAYQRDWLALRGKD
ncbi:MAG TPA: DUF2339 domain-containing protein [Acidisarcina sp.]